MATDGQDPCIYGIDVEKYTKCPCCLKTYDDPWFLQCGHTMNSRCIRKQQPIVRCYVCEDTFLQATCRLGRNRFASDLALKVTYREITNLLLTNPGCSLSQHTDKSAVSYCEKCSMRMCFNCNQFHSMNPSTKRHKTYDVSEMIAGKCQGDITVNPQSLCEHHDYEIIKSWCLDCKIPACDESCSEHHLESLSEHASSAEREIKIIKEKLETGLSAIKVDFEVVKQNRRRIKREGHYKGEIASELDWSKQKCKLVIKIYIVLLREVALLQKKGNEFHKCYTLPFFSFQTKRIQESTNSIPSSSRCASISSSASTNSDSSWTATSSMYINSRQSNPLYISSDRATYMNMRRMSKMDALYDNEQLYTDISQIESSRVKESSLSWNRSTHLSEDIHERLNYFDTESRITGMVFVNDTIIVASHSAGCCTGYDIHGKNLWDITERLNGPFDVAAYKSDDGKQYLYITDPGRRYITSDATIHVFKLRKNERYSFERRFTKNCGQPRGICVASSKVYVCEPEKNEVIEYTICRNGTGKVLNKYGKGVVFLKQPLYISVETGDRIRLLISDTELGLKRVVIHERENNTSGWKSPKGEHFTPSKPCVCKKSVVVGNSTGQKLHFVNFQTRKLSHKEYEIEDRFHSPVALAFDSDHGYLIMACKDGLIVIYRTVDFVEMYEIVPEVKDDDPLYANHYFAMK
ncbi:uncharacterized protein LOC133175610 [Saccostrea echinata]|uniref:uncharacterized protein LOC133175610 n=1 Tax=Saccostrea echinata TaxID=191078 RepID=UPI002A8228C2|nr:uncharacterized protein LOC133175610 [Saccostrea echinata]